ncbi:MAG: hypothetical protein ACRERD_07615 [Candidatus Binatia bacterium]
MVRTYTVGQRGQGTALALALYGALSLACCGAGACAGKVVKPALSQKQLGQAEDHSPALPKSLAPALAASLGKGDVSYHITEEQGDAYNADTHSENFSVRFT